MSCNFKTNKTMEDFNNERKKDYRAEIWTGILMAVMFTIIFLGSCTKKEYIILPTPVECEKKDTATYEFSPSDLIGEWKASKIIQNGKVVTRFIPEENIVIIEEDVMGMYLNNYYTTPSAVGYAVIRDSIKLLGNNPHAFKYVYKHDSSLSLIGLDKNNASIHLEFLRN